MLGLKEVTGLVAQTSVEAIDSSCPFLDRMNIEHIPTETSP